MKRGFFITVEGIEGVGKSTNLALIESWLKERQVSVRMTREPGGTPLAEEIRELLLQPRDETMDEKAELLMVFAARAQHLSQVIQPSLASGDWVVSDRFTDATYAYQGGGRGMDLAFIGLLESEVQGSLRPDTVFLLDAPYAISQQRVQGRGEGKDRFEQEHEAFFNATRAQYLARAEAQPKRYQIIDATQPLAQVQKQIIAGLEQLFEQWQRQDD